MWLRLLAMTVLLALAALWMADAHDGLYLEFQQRSTAAGRGQLFVDYGSGLHEGQSVWYEVFRSDGFQEYRVPFPQVGGSPVGIRLDPIDSEAMLVLRAVRIVDENGAIVRELPIAGVRAVRLTDPLRIEGVDLHVRVPPSAMDPGLILAAQDDGKNPLASSGTAPSAAGRGLSKVLGGFLAAGVCLAVILFPHAIQRGLVVANRRFVRSPVAMIVAGALGGTVVAAYPVIFCGMSYVTPPFWGSLYDRFPWIPGCSFRGPFENLGIDDGASYWTTIPNTVVQHEAIFRHHEFPFWNRYVGGGIPLYAQGQSMIGDPLHLIPVWARGSSLGWDIKTIIEKLVFSAGMGILVHRLTGNLPAGIMLAVAANFLGFFQWRLNHPALFVITYCPWVILAWINLATCLTTDAATWRRRSLATLGLACVAFVQLNAGAPKEGVVAGAFAHSLGCASFFMRLRERFQPLPVVAATAWSLLALMLCTAPYWMLFLDALGKSFTIYSPAAYSFAGQSPLLFFEPFFMKHTSWLMTSTSLPVLVATVVALVGLVWQRPAVKVVCCLLAGLALAVAFGIVPESLIIRTPLLQGIHHVGNTFSVAAITPVLVLAGFGVADFMAGHAHRRRTLAIAAAAVIVSLLVHWALVFPGIRPPAFTPPPPRLREVAALGTLAGLSATLLGLLACLVLVAIRSHSRWPWYAAAVFAAPLLLRCSLHVPTGIPAIDLFAHVANADPRIDHNVQSEAVSFLKNTLDHGDAPARVIGKGRVFFPGYGIRYLLEGVVPVEPLRNRYMDPFLDALGYPDLGTGWLKLIEGHQLASRSRLLDMLNVGYVLAMPGEVSCTSLWQQLPFCGSRANEVADVNGDGRADLIAWNDADVWVSLASSTGDAFGGAQLWLDASLRGDVCQHVADIDGDKRADLIAWSRNSRHVALANEEGTGFRPPETFEDGEFFGSRANLCGDVNGDGCHDLIAWTDSQILVSLGSADGFSRPKLMLDEPFVGGRSLQVADVNGDGRDDLVAWNEGDLRIAYVNHSGTAFLPPRRIDTGRFRGDRADVVGDVNGDGRADFVAWSDTDVTILWNRASDANEQATDGDDSASQPPKLTVAVSGRFFGNVNQKVADVNGDGCDDLIAWNQDSKWVALANSDGTGFMPPGLTLAHSSDLDVWKRESSWPRAFFTSTIVTASTDQEFVELVARTPPPFAIVSAVDKPVVAAVVAGVSRPARQYALTPNSTEFTVDADGPGMIVLHEGFYAGDFVATLNGRRTGYVKVNGTFKGIPVAGAGTYRVVFTYRPAKLGLALSLAVLGLAMCLTGPALFPGGGSHGAVSHT